MTNEFEKDKWTCPNDRHLQLRAKLNAGWSYHSEQNMPFNSKNTQLTESELIAIQKVLQRSEYLEKVEQDRVSKLVERLDNMKRNALQPGSTPQTSNRCAICGDYFCLLRSTPINCNICQKTLCSKCCIDTLCSVDDITSRTNGLSLSYKNSNNLNNQKTLWLCRICSEQRELWKKSGAWFLKKYPSYMVPNLKSYASITSTLSEPQNKEQHKFTLSSPLSMNKEQITHQVSFSLPTTPNKQKFISSQNSPNKFWTRNNSQNRDNLLTDSFDFDEQTNELIINDSTTDNNNNNINNNSNISQNYSSTNNNTPNSSSLVQPTTSINQQLPYSSNVFIPNTLNTINFGNNNIFTINNVNNVNVNPISSNNITNNNNNSNNKLNIINSNNTTSNNVTRESNSSYINNSTSTSPNNSKNSSNASSPTSLKNIKSNPTDTNVVTNLKSTPQRSRRSFRKPKILEWCSTQFSFGESGSNSSLNNDTRKKTQSTSSTLSSPHSPLIKLKVTKNSNTNMTENLS